MTLAALVIVVDDMPQWRIVGLDWPEFLVRRAARIGAGHIVLLIQRMPRGLVASIDRIRGDGIAIDLARTPAEAADRLHPDETVLLLSGSAVVSLADLNALAAAGRPAVLCVAESPETAMFERIDATVRWAGVATVAGQQVRETAAILGDWDFGSTVMRRAMQAGAARIEAAAWPIAVATAGDAIGASRSVLAGIAQTPQGWGNRFVVSPLARLLAALVIDRSLSVNRIIPWVAVVLMAAAVAGAGMAAPALSALGIVAASVAIALCDDVRRASGLRSFLAQYLPLARDGAALAALAATVLPGPVDHAATVLAVALAATSALIARLRSVPGQHPPWLADVPGHALIVAAGGVFGSTGLVLALGAAMLHGFASLGWLQNRLSTVLTTRR